MRCLVCQSFSFLHICKRCQKLLKPTLQKRELLPDFFVYTFYKYSEIEMLLLSKYEYIGNSIYTILAKNSFKNFSKNFSSFATVVPIDDTINRYGYAHTAILARSMKTTYLKPKFNILKARNRVHYAGKSLSFRLQNPRDFIYKGKKEDIILIDDIVTTGVTLKEAFCVCKRSGANPLFALTLADAKE